MQSYRHARRQRACVKGVAHAQEEGPPSHRPQPPRACARGGGRRLRLRAGRGGASSLGPPLPAPFGGRRTSFGSPGLAPFPPSADRPRAGHGPWLRVLRPDSAAVCRSAQGARFEGTTSPAGPRARGGAGIDPGRSAALSPPPPEPIPCVGVPGRAPRSRPETPRRGTGGGGGVPGGEWEGLGPRVRIRNSGRRVLRARARGRKGDGNSEKGRGRVWWGGTAVSRRPPSTGAWNSSCSRAWGSRSIGLGPGPGPGSAPELPLEAAPGLSGRSAPKKLWDQTASVMKGRLNSH